MKAYLFSHHEFSLQLATDLILSVKNFDFISFGLSLTVFKFNAITQMYYLFLILLNQVLFEQLNE